MKKLMMGLVAVLATTFAVPAFAQDKPAEEGKAGEAKGKKKGKKKAKKGAEEKPAEGAAPAPAPAK